VLKRAKIKTLGPFADLITSPSLILVTGKCASGKTTLAVQLIREKLCDHQLYYALVPSFHVQTTFDPVRKLFRDRNVFTDPDQKTLEYVVKSIKDIANLCAKKGVAIPKTLILIDDLAGNSIIHGNRRGCFSNFVTQYRHYNVTIMVISQQPKSVDPNFRDNVSHTIVFPSEREEEVAWMKGAYNSSILRNRSSIEKIISSAWRGFKINNDEVGEHFLYIQSKARGLSRFFLDFDSEISP